MHQTEPDSRASQKQGRSLIIKNGKFIIRFILEEPILPIVLIQGNLRDWILVKSCAYMSRAGRDSRVAFIRQIAQKVRAKTYAESTLRGLLNR